MTTTPKPTALNCPFCGKEPVIDDIPFSGDGKDCDVRCNNFGCAARPSSGYFATVDEAITAWNHRPGEDAARREGFEAGQARLPGYHSYDSNSGYSSCDAEMRGHTYIPGGAKYPTFDDYEKERSQK